MSNEAQPSAAQDHKLLWQRLLGLPDTGAGWWSVGLTAAFFVLFGVFQMEVASGQRGGQTFFSNPLLAWTMLLAAAAAIMGGLAAALAIMWKRERSLFVIAALVWGAFVLVFAIGESFGHD